MSAQNGSVTPLDPLDELVTQLLECGAFLSQMISGMVRWEAEAGGLAPPDTAPIPEVAHSLIRGVLDDVRKRYSKRDIRVAAAIVAESTHAMFENIFAVDPKLLKELKAEEEGAAPGDGR